MTQSIQATAFILAILFFTLNTGCLKDFSDKDYMGERIVIPGNDCLMTGYTCTTNGDTGATVYGIVRVDSTNGFKSGITDSSSWDEIVYEKDDYIVSFFMGGIECRLLFPNDFRPIGGTYFPALFVEESISGRFVNEATRQLDYININVRANSSFNTIDHTIDSVVYSNGDLISYVYTESLNDFPYTVILREKYSFEYDETKEYDYDLYPNNLFFLFNYRPLLSRQYSLGERFDAQNFSKHLITSKRKEVDNLVMFQNTYTFDSDGRIATFKQRFLNGGPSPTEFFWTYTYTCN